jgi:hypothetical protein
VTVLAIAAALVLVAFVCGWFTRNTEGARPTDQPGALAGNLATLFVGAIVAVIAVVAIVAATR